MDAEVNAKKEALLLFSGGKDSFLSCSVKLQYSNKGVFHQPGIFIESLKNQLTTEKIEIPFLGINRRGMKKALKELKQLFSQQKNLLDF